MPNNTITYTSPGDRLKIILDAKYTNFLEKFLKHVDVINFNIPQATPTLIVYDVDTPIMNETYLGNKYRSTIVDDVCFGARSAYGAVGHYHIATFGTMYVATDHDKNGVVKIRMYEYVEIHSIKYLKKMFKHIKRLINSDKLYSKLFLPKEERTKW